MVVPVDVAPPVVGALKTEIHEYQISLYRIASCSQEEVAGLAALSASLLFPKRPPPRVLELADVPVPTAVVLPVALEFPAPGNKLPLLPLVPVDAPVP